MDKLPDTTEEERAQAKAMRENEKKGTIDETERVLVDSLEASQLSPNARQKYVLIQVKHGDYVRYLVRGNQYAAYHMNVAERTLAELKLMQVAGLEYKVLGGGRIVHSDDSKTIDIYGYSYGFPWENENFRHDISAEVLSKYYPDYKITTSNEGY